MTILLALIAAAALLYYWLLGHWFARVLVFLGLAFAGIFATIIATDYGGLKAFIVGCIAFNIAVYGSGLPIYYWRRQLGL